RRGHERASVAGPAGDALAHARHSDPFALLGPHRADRGIVIRTYQPSAEGVAVLRDGFHETMMRVHPSGIFEATFEDAADVFDYRFRVRYPDGRSTDTGD